MGTRGIPAAYGGFETFAEEIAVRLQARGHDVTVYGRSHVVSPTISRYRGVRLRVLPTIQHKYLDTVAHTALSIIDALRQHFDVVLICNNANAPLAAIPRVAGAAVVLNVDGLEWQRAKWGRLGSSYYRFCAWLSPRLPVTLVSDARVIVAYYQQRFGKETVYIPYGTDAKIAVPGKALDEFGLIPNEYILYVSRLEPENNAHLVIEAYRRAGGLDKLGVPLVLVGDAPYATEYKRNLHAESRRVNGVTLPGYVFGDGYAELQSNAMIYVQATSVGGTHPALVEAMGRGRCIVANDVPEHREVLGDAGRYFKRDDAVDMSASIADLARDAAARAELGAAARERALSLYSWEAVTDRYEELFRAIRV